MIVVLLRGVIVVLALWGLWKLYPTLFPARRLPRKRIRDDWGEVLEAIDELPETPAPPRQIQKDGQPLQQQLQPPNGAMSPAPIESVLVQEAEAALSRLKEGDDNERLAAYYEIAAYAKLCTIPACHISAATGRTIAEMRRQAWGMISPPENP